MDAGEDEGVSGGVHLLQWQSGFPCQPTCPQDAFDRKWPVGGRLEQAVQTPCLILPVVGPTPETLK